MTGAGPTAGGSEPGPAAPGGEAEQAGVLLWGRLAALAAETATPLVVVRVLGKTEVGSLAALLLVYNTGASLLAAGLPQTALYFLAGKAVGARRGTVAALHRIALALALLMALLMAALGHFGPAWLGEASRALGGRHAVAGGASADLRYLPLLGIYALLEFPTRLLPSVLVVESRPRLQAAFGLAQSVALILATLVPAALGLGLPGVLAGLLSVGAAVAASYFALIRRLYRAAAAGPGRTVDLRAILRHFVPLAASQVTNLLGGSLDLWLVVLLFPAERVAVYRAGAFQIPLLTAVAYTVGAVYTPRFAVLFAEGRGAEAVRLWRATVEKVSLLIVPSALALIVGAEEFVVIAFTDAYADAAGVFRAYAFVILGRVAAFGALLVAAGRPRLILLSSCFALVATAACAIPLGLLAGLVGPAVGVALAFVPIASFYCAAIARAAGIPIAATFPVRTYGRVLAVAALPVGAAVAFKLSVAAPPSLALAAEAALVLGGFAWIGTRSGLISAADWRFAGRWLRMDLLR